MLEVLIVVLILAWLLGVFVVPVGSNAVHLLLVIVVVVVVVRLLRGERP